MRCTFFSMAVALVLCLPFSAYAYDWQKDGERLHYAVYYGFLKAGEAELLYVPETHGTTYRIVARAWTDSLFFHLLERLTVRGVHQEGQPFSPSEYAQMQIENDFKADKTVRFNPTGTQATFENKLNAAAPEVFELPPSSRDMLSGLYFLRQAVPDLKGDIPRLSLMSLCTPYFMDVALGDEGRLKTAQGKVFLQEIKPVFFGPDGQKLKDDWRIWITADERRLPARIELKSKFGTFKAVLLSVSPAASVSAAPATLPEEGSFIYD